MVHHLSTLTSTVVIWGLNLSSVFGWTSIFMHMIGECGLKLYSQRSIESEIAFTVKTRLNLMQNMLFLLKVHAKVLSDFNLIKAIKPRLCVRNHFHT